MNVRRILFLSLGLERVYPPMERERAKAATDKLVEPDGARLCRRNILALAGIVVVTGFAGADPRDLVVFGVKPSGYWGLHVLASAVVLLHLYWYILRFFHMRDDGKIEQNPEENLTHNGHLKISWNDFCLVRRGADLFSNRAAFVLSILSWYFVASWIFH